MKWFRFYGEVLDDPKVARMSDRDYRIFTYLLCMASEAGQEGLVPMATKEMAWRLRRPEGAVKKAIDTLVELRILAIEQEGVRFINWSKRQFRSDDVNERVRRHRGKETFQETLQGTAPDQNRTETEKSRRGNGQGLSSGEVPDVPLQKVAKRHAKGNGGSPFAPCPGCGAEVQRALIENGRCASCATRGQEEIERVKALIRPITGTEAGGRA